MKKVVKENKKIEKPISKNKTFFGLFLVVVSIATLFHFIYWSKFSLDVTLLKAQQLAGLRSQISYYTEMGAICNELKKYDCAISYFEEVLLVNPKDTKAMGNIATIYSKNKEYNKAITYFNLYQKNSGKAYDVIFWHGKTLLSQGDKEGLRNVIYSAGLNQKNKEHIEKVVAVLTDYGRQDLALSLIGSIVQGDVKKIKEWDQIMSEPQLLNYKSMSNGWEALSFNTRTFYSPVKLRKQGRIKIFELEFWDNHNLLTYDTLDENLIPYTKDEGMQPIKLKSGRKIMATPVVLESFYIAGLMFKNLKFFACEDCNHQISKKFLTQFETEKTKTQRVNYIKFKLKPNSNKDGLE